MFGEFLQGTKDLLDAEKNTPLKTTSGKKRYFQVLTVQTKKNYPKFIKRMKKFAEIL